MNFDIFQTLPPPFRPFFQVCLGCLGQPAAGPVDMPRQCSCLDWRRILSKTFWDCQDGSKARLQSQIINWTCHKMITDPRHTRHELPQMHKDIIPDKQVVFPHLLWKPKPKTQDNYTQKSSCNSPTNSYAFEALWVIFLRCWLLPQLAWSSSIHIDHLHPSFTWQNKAFQWETPK